MSPINPARAELFVRADTFGTHDLQTDIKRRLDRLEEDGALADVEVSGWQSRVRLDAADSEAEARTAERFHLFERWADRQDVSLEPFFETWTRRSEVLDEEYEELVTPVLCLTLLDRDELIEVAPHRRGDDTRTVRDCLADLETRPPAGSTKVLVEGNSGEIDAPEGEGTWELAGDQTGSNR